MPSCDGVFLVEKPSAGSVCEVSWPLPVGDSDPWLSGMPIGTVLL